MNDLEKFKYLVSALETAKVRAAVTGFPVVVCRTVRGELFVVNELVATRYVKRGAEKIIVVQPPNRTNKELE